MFSSALPSILNVLLWEAVVSSRSLKIRTSTAPSLLHTSTVYRAPAYQHVSNTLQQTTKNSSGMPPFFSVFMDAMLTIS